MLRDLYKKEGVPLADTFGVPYPRYLVNPIAEYNALTSFAGVLDLTHYKIFRLTGKDRISFLNAMLTNDVAPLEKNQGCRSLLTSVKGKIVADLFVYPRENDVVVLVTQGDAGETFDVLSKHIIMEDVKIEDISLSRTVIGIEGPKAHDILWRIFPTGPFPKRDMESVEREFEDDKIFIMRHSVSGEEGVHMMVPSDSVVRFRNYVVQASHGSDGMAVGSIALNIRRVENGRPWYSVDFSGDNFPQEARLEETISYTKGCFRGQETLARLHYRGHVNRLLVGLTIDEEPPTETTRMLDAEFENSLNNYDEIGLRKRAAAVAKALDIESAFPPETSLYAPDDEAKPAGRITSAVYSPQLGKSLFLGYVRYEVASEKTSLRVQTKDGEHTASITDLPLADSE